MHKTASSIHPRFSAPLLINIGEMYHFFTHHVPFMMIIPTIVSKLVATNKIFPINDQ